VSTCVCGYVVHNRIVQISLGVEPTPVGVLNGPRTPSRPRPQETLNFTFENLQSLDGIFIPQKPFMEFLNLRRRMMKVLTGAACKSLRVRI
jgi:hypothetical protein